MLVFFTDFSRRGPYVGEMTAAARAYLEPGQPVIDLCHDAPAFRPDLAAYLLAAQARAPVWPARDCAFCCVVDPGVGTERGAVILAVGERRFVGPDNGLLAVLARQAQARGEAVAAYRLTWRPKGLSPSFHGRDLFAPAAARLLRNDPPPNAPLSVDALVGADWPLDWPGVVYIDGFGNAMTGLRAEAVRAGQQLSTGGQAIPWAQTFADVPVGAPLAYRNSDGLAEIAVNQGGAAAQLGLGLGDAVALTGG